MKAGALYCSEVNGNDETGDGTEQKPFKTAIQVILWPLKFQKYFLCHLKINKFLLIKKALKHSGDVENFSKILVDSKDEKKVSLICL